MKRDLEVEGEVKSVSQVARDLGISRTTLQGRLAKGQDLDTALKKPVMKENLWTFEGKTQSIHAWAKEKAIPYPTLWARHNRGWDAEKALTTPIEREVNQTQEARDHGISRGALQKRLAKGMSLDDALNKPLVKKPKEWTYEGKTQNIMEWAKEKSLGYATLLRRYDAGWDAELALTTPINPRRKIDKNV